MEIASQQAISNSALGMGMVKPSNWQELWHCTSKLDGRYGSKMLTFNAASSALAASASAALVSALRILTMLETT